MSSITRHFLPFITTLLAFSFLLVGSFGILHFGIETQSDGTMSGCPFTGEGVICAMSPLGHIAAWQSTFTTTLPGKGSVSLLLLLLISFLSLHMWREIFPRDRDSVIHRIRFKYWERTYFTNPFQEAFSNGIIHPKVF